MILGIASGLTAATLQSITYLLTRHYAEKRAAIGIAGAGRQLIVLGHLLMGFIALAVAPFVWPAAGIPWAAIAWPLVGNTVGYVLGQIGQVVALRHAEASRVGPLMTSKLIFSSLLVLRFGQPVGATDSHITLLQWIAVGLCVVAGISINFSGGKMNSRAAFAIASAAVTFSVSDFCISLMIKEMHKVPGVDPFHASLVAGLLSYFATGLLAIPLLLTHGSRKASDWRDAVPFAVVWFSGMVTLYATFAFVGILLGSILQCTRGFITIIFAAALMHFGHHHIEPKAPHSVVARRFVAGLVMFLGIALYVAKDRATFEKMLNEARGISPATQQTAPATR